MKGLTHILRNMGKQKDKCWHVKASGSIFLLS